MQPRLGAIEMQLLVYRTPTGVIFARPHYSSNSDSETAIPCTVLETDALGSDLMATFQDALESRDHVILEIETARLLFEAVNRPLPEPLPAAEPVTAAVQGD